MSELKYLDDAVAILQNTFSQFGFTPHCYPNAIGLWPNEQLTLLTLALNSDPQHGWMEIGSFCGGSAVLLCIARRCHEAGPAVYSVDRGFEGIFDHNITRAGFQDIHRKLACDSALLPFHHDGSKLSFNFIDGWHSFKGLMLDVFTTEPWLVKDSIVCFHDVDQQPYRDGALEDYFAEAKGKFHQWMNEPLPNMDPKCQDGNLNHAVAWLVKGRGYELIENPLLHGKNHLVALRKTW